MKIIINTTNLVIGGALQVALSFLEEVKTLGDNDEFFVFLSSEVASQLDAKAFPYNFKFFYFSKSPASIRSRRSVISELQTLERQICPDVIFSVFGPSYWRPQSPHVMGFAIGWVINPDSIVFKSITFQKRLENYYKRFYAKRDADFYIVETDEVQWRLEKYLRIDASRIAVVGNTCNHVYEESFEPYLIATDPKYFNLISICANYPHKNLGIIKEIIPFLESAAFKCRFWLTISPEQFNQNFSHLSDWISNLGPVDIRFCPSIYQQGDALFLPTLLESFTASYPEAMKMKKPILTSDLGFAHAICGNAAEYFDPMNPENIAEAIIKVGSSHERQQELVSLGNEQLKLFPSARERAKNYLKIIHSLAKI